MEKALLFCLAINSIIAYLEYRNNWFLSKQRRYDRAGVFACVGVFILLIKIVLLAMGYLYDKFMRTTK